ncbi:hypothetical protein OUZ56_009294 [Daphnia magna]|uniref:Uncharacterized protein n=1 Tax=Daphnia magna TaxID=35525 RepID=A0ABR0AFL2_9CRUS|nr:hypothetical protein OUZ56_009294 [Daphnia magna]
MSLTGTANIYDVLPAQFESRRADSPQVPCELHKTRGFNRTRTLRRRKDVTGLVDSAKLDGRTLSNAIEDCELDVYPSKFDICIGNTKKWVPSLNVNCHLMVKINTTTMFTNGWKTGGKTNSKKYKKKCMR